MSYTEETPGVWVDEITRTEGEEERLRGNPLAGYITQPLEDGKLRPFALPLPRLLHMLWTWERTEITISPYPYSTETEGYVWGFATIPSSQFTIYFNPSGFQPFIDHRPSAFDPTGPTLWQNDLWSPVLVPVVAYIPMSFDLGITGTILAHYYLVTLTPPDVMPDGIQAAIDSGATYEVRSDSCGTMTLTVASEAIGEGVPLYLHRVSGILPDDILAENPDTLELEPVEDVYPLPNIQGLNFSMAVNVLALA